MSDNHAKELLSIIYPSKEVLRGRKLDAERYEQAGKIARWMIRRREPQAFAHYQRELEHRKYLVAQQSVVEARQSAYMNEGNDVIF